MGQTGRNRAERGAAAVEFALVLPVLLLLVFGIIDYGVYFSDTLAARQGVREGARQGVVGNFGGACDSARFRYTGSAKLANLACLTLDRVSAVGGSSYAQVVTNPDSPGDGYAENEDLLVCVVVDEKGVTGLTPLPSGGNVYSRIRMRIEKTPDPPDPDRNGTGEAGNGSSSTPPDGWDWCE